MQATPPAPTRVRLLGEQPYQSTWQAMRAFTDRRDESTANELWLLEHPPVFTLGQAGRPEHVLAPGDIPVVQSDRGGQVTYHGPGQLVLYTLLSLRQLNMGIRSLVHALEDIVVRLLADHGIDAATRADAPGVYVGDAKVCSLGLRVRRGFTYHGLALNIDMDLEPFQRINPCGFPGLPVTDLRHLGVTASAGQVGEQMLAIFAQRFELDLDPRHQSTLPAEAPGRARL